MSNKTLEQVVIVSQNRALMQPIKIGSTMLKNRVVMSGMTTNYVHADGSPSRKLYSYLTERARGGAGLIVMGASSVSWPEGKISERQLAISAQMSTVEALRIASDS